MPSECCMCLSSARIWPRSLASRLESGSSIRKAAGASHDSARERDALALAARELARDSGREACRAAPGAATSTTFASISLRGSRRMASGIGDVVEDGLVRVERVGLEDHGDVAVLRQDVGDVAAADQDAAGGDRLEARDHPQRGRLARARRAEQDEELAGLHLERKARSTSTEPKDLEMASRRIVMMVDSG